MLKIGVLASGRGSNFQSIIDSIEAGRINAKVGLLVVDKAGAYALERAKNHNIPHEFIDPKGFTDKDTFYVRIVDRMRSHGVGLVVLAGFMRIVRKPLLDAFPNRVMNIHPALLPAFPGLHGQGDAVDYGVKVSGCTVHFVDEGMDTGPVIIQAVVPVYDDDTEDSLSSRILKQEHRIYPEAISLFADGRLELRGRKVIVKGQSRQDDEALINPSL